MGNPNTPQATKSPGHIPPAQPPVDMDAVIELMQSMNQEIADLKKAQSNLAVENLALTDKISEAAKQAALHKPVSSSIGVIGGDNALMPKARIMEFLNSTRPSTEFFVLKNPYYKFQLDAGKEAPFDPQQNRQTGRPIPGFWMCMQFWFGPGCELRKQDGSQKYKIGQCDLASDRLLKITPQDIEKFHMRADHDIRPDGIYDIDTLLHRIYNDDDFRLGKLLTGEMFREMMKAEYDTLWATQFNQEQLAQRLASLRPGAEKTGLLAPDAIDRLTSVLGTEPAKAGSTIVEPVMS